MTTINDICQFMNTLAPCELAEEWDNVGLLVGDHASGVERIMTCLTITPESAGEAITGRADLIVAHHPLPFRSINRVTSDLTVGRMLLDLIKAQVSVYSPHTAFDSTKNGINEMMAQKFDTNDIQPLVAANGDDPDTGAGRVGQTGGNTTLGDLTTKAKRLFNLSSLQYVGDLQQAVNQIAFACGSGGTFLQPAIEKKCDAFVTGETNFHTCLEARARGIGLILLGHFASERFAVDWLAELLGREFSTLEVWASRRDVDPIHIG